MWNLYVTCWSEKYRLLVELDRPFHRSDRVNSLAADICFEGSSRQLVIRPGLDNAIHWIKHYLVDNMVCFVNTYPLDNKFHTLYKF